MKSTVIAIEFYIYIADLLKCSSVSHLHPKSIFKLSKMYQDKKVSSDSSDSGYDSLEGSLDTGNNKARLSIITLGDYCIHIIIGCV